MTSCRPVQGGEPDTARSLRTNEIKPRVKRYQSHAQVTGILRDAGCINTEDGVVTVDPRDRRAAGARVALVASRPARIAKIRAAGSLQHVPTQRRHVPQLSAGGELQALR